MINQTISHYKILEKLGEGGMGIVYKAQDTKLDRIVALKFLPHHISGNEAENSRFLQEAKAAATLNHPHVCTIYGIDEYEGPAPTGKEQFIEMEYVDGETLRRKIPLAKTEDALRYAVQIGEALQEAHAKGIVHRDVKCENIMVNAKNQIKVMDFGLAKLKGSMKLTKTSSTVGTLAYMAPEQIQGGEVDARSDIFSFGIVLFEMLTGKTPFRGEHDAAMMYSIVNEAPETVGKYVPEVSAEIERIVQRALEKDPDDRYQTAADMVSEIRRVQKQSTKVTRTIRQQVPAAVPQAPEVSVSNAAFPAIHPRRSRKTVVMIGSMAAFLISLALIGYVIFFRPAKTIDSLAVLPFVNAGADPNTEYLSDGITESLINGLSQLSNLTVMSRSSVFHYKGKDIDPQKAGKELGVKAILTGRVAQRGDDLLISAELVDVANNSHIWGEQYNKKVSDILAIQEEISKEISGKLSLKLAGEDEKKLANRPTENTEAYQLYLKGRFHWNKRKADDLQKAIEYYNQAIEKDPNYALAYAGLASTYTLLPEYAGAPTREAIPKAKEAAQKASELDPSLAEPHAVLGLAGIIDGWDWKGAEKEFQRAIQLNPNYPTVHHWFSICLRQQGKFEPSLAEITRAQQLDPLSPVININVAETFRLLHRDDEAMEQLQKNLEIDANFPGTHGDLGLMYLKQGNFDAAIKEAQKVREIVGPENPVGIAELGFVLARAGRREDAVKMLDKLLELSKQGNHWTIQIASIYTGLGEKDNAFKWLDKGYEERSALLCNLKIAPVWDNLHSDPRFTVLLNKIGLAQ